VVATDEVTLTKAGARRSRRTDGVLDQVRDDLLKPL